MLRKTLLAVLVLTMVVGIGSVAMAELNPTPDNPVTLRVGYADNPAWPSSDQKVPQPEHGYAIVFQQIVESRTNGAVKVELFPSSQLGSPKEMVEMTQSGTLDAAIQTGVMGGFFPEFQVINIPFVFQSEEIAWWVFDHSDYWRDLMARMEEETGLKSLGMGQNGVRNFTNNERPIREPKDMAGLKFRVMESPIYVKMIEALGAKAIPIAWNEVYTALQTGVVDGQENPLATIYYIGKLYEVQKYLTMDGHVWSENQLLMNADKFNSFPEDIQTILMAAGRQGALVDRASETLQTRILAYDALKKEMEIYVPTSSQIKKFQNTAQPPVVEWLKGEVGDEVVDEFFAAVEAAEEALGY